MGDQPRPQYQPAPAPRPRAPTGPQLSAAQVAGTAALPGETDEMRRARLARQSLIVGGYDPLGGYNGGGSDGNAGVGGNADSSSTGAEGSSSDGTI